MIGYTLDTSEAEETFGRYVDAMNKAPGIYATLTRRRVQRSKGRIIQKVSVEPENTPNLPFVWSYDPVKQKRARGWYFANVVKGSQGGRYQRTHKTSKAWDVRVTVDENGGHIEAFNNADGVDYVMGDRQVPSHYATGWLNPPELDDIILDEAILLEDQLTTDWYTAVDPFAGVR